MTPPHDSRWRLIRPAVLAERAAAVRLVCWSLVEAAPALLSGWLIARAVDDGFLAGRPRAGLLLLGCYGLLLLAGALAARQTMGPLAALVESVRDRLVRTVVESALAQATRAGTPPDAGAVARTTRQSEAVRQITASLLTVARTVAFTVPAVVIGLWTIAPEIAALTAASLVAAALLLSRISTVLRRRYTDALTTEEDLAARTGQLLEGLRDIAACGARRRAAGDASAAVEAQAAASMATTWAGTGRIGVIAIGARVPLVLTLLLTPWLLDSGRITPGEAVGATTYLVTGLEPAVRALVLTVGNMGLHLGVLLRMLSVRSAVPLAPTRPPGRRFPKQLGLTAHGLAFSYGPHSEPVVKGLDLSVGPGAHLAVVGPSGAGKSTLAALLSGLERPDAGAVRLGGVHLDEVDPSWLRSRIALVPQEAYVFAGTIRENVGYFRDVLPDDELSNAVGIFGLHGTLERLGGPDVPFSGPGVLSAGERQLLVLARTYVSRARIVVLDEATCHLDPVAEARAEQAFMDRPSTALVVVAHRASSALRAQQVLVLEGGTALIGDHSGLLRRSPLYAELMAGHPGSR